MNKRLMNKRLTNATKRESGIGARVVIVIVLAATFVGVLHWSLRVTTANAKQISQNLSQIQQQMNADVVRNRDRDLPGAKVKIAPSIDPAVPDGR